MAQTRTLYEPSIEHDACGFGFVVDIAGRPSHAIVRDALTVLVNLEHRGATGAEKNTGDGAGHPAPGPPRFLARGRGRGRHRAARPRRLRRRRWSSCRATRPAARPASRTFEESLARRGPARSSAGATSPPTAHRTRRDRPRQPAGHPPGLRRPPGAARRTRTRLRAHGSTSSAGSPRRPSPARALPGAATSTWRSRCRTIVYKGMLNASQLGTFYPDLLDTRVQSAIAMVHSRFSTNTFPSLVAGAPVPLHLATTARSTRCAGT